MTGSLAVGAVLRGASRTITDAEVAILPALMGAINPLFHDEVRAAAGPMGGRVLYGPALLGIAVGLTEPLLADRVMGLMEIQSVRFRRPVRPGDTVSAALEVVALEPRSGKPGLVMTTADTVVNQGNEVVLRFGRRILVRELDAGPETT